MAITALVLHRVSDYDGWRSVYNSVEGIRTRGGVTAAEVFRPVNGDNLVPVTHDFDTPAGLPVRSSRTRS